MERSVIERWTQTSQLLVSRPTEEASRLSFIISRVRVICSRPINKQQEAVQLEVEADVLEPELLSPTSVQVFVSLCYEFKTSEQIKSQSVFQFVDSTQNQALWDELAAYKSLQCIKYLQ